MIEYRADWVVPVAAPPVRHGSVVVDGARVVEVRPLPEGERRAPGQWTTVDLGPVAVMPGLVNAHTHLELSWLRSRIPSVSSFPEWIRFIIRARRERAAAAAQADRLLIDEAIEEARRFGTVLVGDISNTLSTFDRLVARRMKAVVFNELIGFNPGDPRALVDAARSALDRLGATADQRVTLAAHAPYSVSPALFRCIAEASANQPSTVTSVHLGESLEEVEFLHSGRGAWRQLLDELGAWNDSWTPPGCGPVEYLDRVGFLGPRVLVVHGVQLTERELDRLAAAGATLVTCPRGNLNTAAGTPPVARFFQSGVRVAVGTDSLASVPDLNVFEELAALRRLAPDVPASALLRAATLNGARALGFDEFGSIEAGKAAELLAVPVPAFVTDVEEYLVSGRHSGPGHWIVP